MIIDIPTHEDFTKHGLMFLNLSWESIISLFVEDGVLADEEITAEYWEASRPSIAIAHALAQQGAELLLKAQIATYSPFLLVATPPKEWPKLNQNNQMRFADFRTLDAQDLVKTFNTLSPKPLDADLVKTFTKFRLQRNALLHTVDDDLEFSFHEVIKYILTFASIASSKTWPALRRHFIENDAIIKTVAVDDAANVLVNEMLHMFDILKPAEFKSFMGKDPKQRRYICPNCYLDMNRDYDPEPPYSAFLNPNTPESTSVECFICDKISRVFRKDCPQEECMGNVISAISDNECLTCFEPKCLDVG